MISLPIDVQKEIVNTLVHDDVESRLLYLQAINNASGRGTKNSEHTYKWDCKYNDMIDIADKHGLKYLKLNRGRLWEPVLLFGNDDDVYVFLRNKNMNRIIRQGKRTHYLPLLNLFNKPLNDLIPLQPSFSDLDDDLNGSEEEMIMARQMLNIMEKEPEKVIVFSFEGKFNPVVKAHAFNRKQQMVWETDLSEMIEPNYRFVLQDDGIEPESRESEISKKLKAEERRIVKLKI